MSTTISMWLGISFVGLGILAVLLQAWLWNPRYWDHVNHKTRAPRWGLFLHRWVGIAFTVIYVVLMIEMVPRLWEYQVELPARTVIHATAAITLGILLFTKLAILRIWRHFEESMPALGFGILVCTIILAVLSIPFALRAQGLGVDAFTPENLDRVENLMGKIDFEEEVDPRDLLTTAGLSRGRQALVGDCVRCHDMRTILAQPRSAPGWYKTVLRMTEKPSVFGEPADPGDVPYVTAYLVAITPEIQESRALKAEQERKRQEVLANIIGKMASGPTAPVVVPVTPPPASDAGAKVPESGAPATTPAVTPPAPVEVLATIDAKVGDPLLQKYCTDCHDLAPEITNYGGGDINKWSVVMSEMVAEGAEIPSPEAQTIIRYLAQIYPPA